MHVSSTYRPQNQLLPQGNLSAAVPYTFSAKERDSETGLSYFGARYYTSDLSIWLSVDPMSDKFPSLSPYVYCANNPVKLVDPNGEDVWKPDGKGGWIAQAGDNAWTLHRDAGISFEKAIELMKAQGFVFTDNDQKVKVQVGDRVQVSEPSYNKYDIPYRPPASGRIDYSPFNVEDIVLLFVPVKWKVGDLLFRHKAAKFWRPGSHKSETKWLNQFANRGWTPEDVTYTIKTGKSYPATNMINKANGATRFQNPKTGKSIVIDDKTYELIHVGGENFKW